MLYRWATWEILEEVSPHTVHTRGVGRNAGAVNPNLRLLASHVARACSLLGTQANGGTEASFSLHLHWMWYKGWVVFLHCCLVTKSCLTLQPHGLYILPGSSVHGISQARILEWVSISFSRGPFQPRDQTFVSCICRQFLYHWANKEATSVFVVIDTHWDLLRAKAKPTSKPWYLGRGLHVIWPPLFHFSCLLLTGLVGHPRVTFSFHPLLLPSPRFYYQLLILNL